MNGVQQNPMMSMLLRRGQRPQRGRQIPRPTYARPQPRPTNRPNGVRLSSKYEMGMSNPNSFFAQQMAQRPQAPGYPGMMPGAAPGMQQPPVSPMSGMYGGLPPQLMALLQQRMQRPQPMGGMYGGQPQRLPWSMSSAGMFGRR